MLSKACPRCHGDLFPERYEGGGYSCLQCGAEVAAAAVSLLRVPTGCGQCEGALVVAPPGVAGPPSLAAEVSPLSFVCEDGRSRLNGLAATGDGELSHSGEVAVVLSRQLSAGQPSCAGGVQVTRPIPRVADAASDVSRCPVGGGLPDFLAQEQWLETTDLDEALAACETGFRFSRTEISVAQLSLDSSLALRVGDETYRLTERAFDDLCAIVKLPVSFAKVIPTDLTSTIVQRLKRHHQQTVVLITRDRTVVGIVDPLKWSHRGSPQGTRRPHYQPVEGAVLLRVIQKVWTGLDQALRIVVADSGLLVELVRPGAEIQPRVGDVTRVGLAITSSETGGPMPQARGFTLRLTCTNGAALPEQFGLARFSGDWRVNFEVRLAAFEAELRRLSLDLEALRAVYARLLTERVTDHLFYNLHREVRYIYRRQEHGDALADRALGVDQQVRQEISGQVRRRQAELRRGSPDRLEGPRLTGLLAWDVFNAITAAAREEPYQRRVALQRLGGDLLGGSGRNGLDQQED